MPTLHASCLCGAIRWEVDGPLPAPDPEDRSPSALLRMSHCHCSRCRKAHGAPYATYVAVPEATFRLTHGAGRMVRWASRPGVHRAFCGTCGSVVPDGSAWKGWVAMPAGNFDEDLELRPRCHIFVGSKAPWVSIGDDLPRFDAYPKELDVPPVDTRAALDAATGAPRGSCLCGAVAYVVVAPPIRCRTCHCSRCRKAGSAAHVSYLATTYEGVRFTRGEDLVSLFKLPDARHFGHAFCRTCGSTMPRKDVSRGLAFIAMGSLDDDPGIRPAQHIYVGSRAAWDTITDAVPQFEENGPT